MSFHSTILSDPQEDDNSLRGEDDPRVTWSRSSLIPRCRIIVQHISTRRERLLWMIVIFVDLSRE